MKKILWGVIGTLCLVAVGAASSCCTERTPSEEPTAVETRAECEPVEMREVTIRVDSKTQPIIPFIKVPYTPSQDAKDRRRFVTFKVEGGAATVIIPVEGALTSANPLPVNGIPGCSAFKVNEENANTATLEITLQNTEDIEIEYQVLCDDNGTLYWAKGQSPPRMQIPPV